MIHPLPRPRGWLHGCMHESTLIKSRTLNMSGFGVYKLYLHKDAERASELHFGWGGKERGDSGLGSLGPQGFSQPESLATMRQGGGTSRSSSRCGARAAGGLPCSPPSPEPIWDSILHGTAGVRIQPLLLTGGMAGGGPWAPEVAGFSKPGPQRHMQRAERGARHQARALSQEMGAETLRGRWTSRAGFRLRKGAEGQEGEICPVTAAPRDFPFVPPNPPLSPLPGVPSTAGSADWKLGSGQKREAELVCRSAWNSLLPVATELAPCPSGLSGNTTASGIGQA